MVQSIQGELPHTTLNAFIFLSNQQSQFNIGYVEIETMAKYSQKYLKDGPVSPFNMKLDIMW